jgi:hypothetical protein
VVYLEMSSELPDAEFVDPVLTLLATAGVDAAAGVATAAVVAVVVAAAVVEAFAGAFLSTTASL